MYEVLVVQKLISYWLIQKCRFWKFKKEEDMNINEEQYGSCHTWCPFVSYFTDSFTYHDYILIWLFSLFSDSLLLSFLTILLLSLTNHQRFSASYHKGVVVFSCLCLFLVKKKTARKDFVWGCSERGRLNHFRLPVKTGWGPVPFNRSNG